MMRFILTSEAVDCNLVTRFIASEADRENRNYFSQPCLSVQI